MSEPRPESHVGDVTLTQWDSSLVPDPYVTGFPEQHRVQVPNKPYVVFNTQRNRNKNKNREGVVDSTNTNTNTNTNSNTNTNQVWSGQDMVISFSAPCSGILHQSVLARSSSKSSSSSSSQLVGSVMLPEVRLDSGAAGYCTKLPALGNKTCFVFSSDELKPLLALENNKDTCTDKDKNKNQSGKGVLVVLCQYAISEPRLEEWFEVVLSTFQPSSLHIIEDVPISNLLKNEEFISFKGEKHSCNIEVITAGPSPFLAASASAAADDDKDGAYASPPNQVDAATMSVWPDLEQAVCSQVFSEVSRILSSTKIKSHTTLDTYHPIAIVHGQTRMTVACMEKISACLGPLLEKMAGVSTSASSEVAVAEASFAEDLRQGIKHLHAEFIQDTKTDTWAHASIYV